MCHYDDLAAGRNYFSIPSALASIPPAKTEKWKTGRTAKRADPARMGDDQVSTPAVFLALEAVCTNQHYVPSNDAPGPR